MNSCSKCGHLHNGSFPKCYSCMKKDGEIPGLSEPDAPKPEIKIKKEKHMNDIPAPVARNCKRCGKPLPLEASKRVKRCEKCAKIVQREQAAAWQRAKGVKPKVKKAEQKPKIIVKTSDEDTDSKILKFLIQFGSVSKEQVEAIKDFI